MGDARRDRWGRYLVVPPGGDRPVGYTRATTIAKTLDDGGGLIPWKATATMVGALRRPGLMARWQTLMAEHPDPWYASTDSKNTAKKLVEECATAGGSADRAEIGTALHALVEHRLNGTAGTPILQPAMQADLEAFTRTVDAAGITFDKDLIEAVVVLDEYQVAGTADQLCAHLPGIGHVVSDLKTGADLKYSWQAIAIQLATYVHADNVYVQGEHPGGSEDRRLPMPELSREVGLVIHLPAGEARCELHLVDLTAGWEAFQLSIATRRWRARRDLTRAHAVEVTPAAEPPAFDDAPPAVAVAELPAFDDVPVAADRQESAEREASAGSWLRDAQQARRDVDHHAELRRTAGQRLARGLDEGAGADIAALDVARGRYDQLDASAREWITTLARDAMTANVSFHAKDTKTVRRFEILRGLLQLCDQGVAGNGPGDADEIIRAVLEHVIGEVAHHTDTPAGHLVGSLDHREARAFADQCTAFAEGRFAAWIRPDGRFALRQPDLAAPAA